MRKSDYLTSFDLLAKYLLIIEQGFKGVLATRFGSLETENYHRVPRIRENQVPTGPYWVPNIFLKKACMEFRFDAMYSNLDNGNSGAGHVKCSRGPCQMFTRAMSNVHAGHVKCSRGPQVPRPCFKRFKFVVLTQVRRTAWAWQTLRTSCSRVLSEQQVNLFCLPATQDDPDIAEHFEAIRHSSEQGD